MKNIVKALVVIGLYSSSTEASVGPNYSEDWPYKVTEHSTSEHQSCSVHNATESGCDHIIGPDTYNNTIRIKPGKTMPLPGDKICILPGTYHYAEIFKTHGEESAPITIQNCGGQVQIDAEFRIMESTHLALKGHGDDATLYGFKVTGKQKRNTASALSITRFSRDIEVAYTDISAPLGRAALHFNSSKPKRDADGNFIKRYDPVSGELFDQSNTHIHHNFIHSSLEGEGIYLGIAGCGEEEFNAGASLTNTYVHDNIVVDNGADGIQVGCGREKTFIFNNYIENAGFNPFRPNAGHTKGIQIGAGTSGHVFNNYIENIASDCVFIGSTSSLEQGRDIALSVYNNIAVDCQHAVGFHSSVKAVVEAGQRFAIANNTFIGMREGRYWVNHHYADAVKVTLKNNLYVDAKITKTDNKYVDSRNSVPHFIVNGTNRVSGNFDESSAGFFMGFDDVNFADAENGNFSLSATSLALDKGTDASDLDVVTDITGTTRTYNDLGAIEFKGERDPNVVDSPSDEEQYDHFALFDITSNGKSSIRLYSGDNISQNRLHITQPGFEFLQFDLALSSGQSGQSGQSGVPNLASIYIFVTASSQTKLLPLSAYAQSLSDEMQKVTIPLADFGFSEGKLEGGIYEVGIKTTSTVGHGIIKLDEIALGNSNRVIVWHGDSRSAAAVFNNKPEALSVKLESTLKNDRYIGKLTASSNGRVHFIKSDPLFLNTERPTELSFQLKSNSPLASLNLAALYVVAQAGGNTVQLPLSGYIEELTDDFQLVVIPIDDFPFKANKLEKGLRAIGFKTSSSIGNGTFYVDEIHLSDSESEVSWLNDEKRDTVWVSNPNGLSYEETNIINVE